MNFPTLSLLVLRTANVEAALAFYRALGLDFRAEQHGVGPLHHAAQWGELVLEIYPAPSGAAPEPKSGGATMLGFRVASLDETLTKLRALNAEPSSPPKNSEWGRWANVTDPDGRVVQLVES